MAGKKIIAMHEMFGPEKKRSGDPSQCFEKG